MSDRIEINNVYIQMISSLISKNQLKELGTIVDNLHIADIAEIIEELSEQHLPVLFSRIKEEKSAEILVAISDSKRELVLSNFTAKKIAEVVINNLESDDATDIIGEFSKAKKEEVLSHIEDIECASNINDLLRYKKDTAGGIMAKELIKVNENWDTLKCHSEMKKQAKSIKKVFTIYVVNNNNELKGSLSLRRLLLSSKGSAIKNIVNTDIVSVNANEDNEDVANIMKKYNLIALPVVDESNKLIGRITFDNVLDVIKEEAEKDYKLASGISENLESNDSILEHTKARLPWLLIGMVGGLMGAKVIGFFDFSGDSLKLVFFIPLIAAMGGNVGIQSAAIVVQGLANDTIKMKNIFHKLTKELTVGLLNGIICSIIILAAAFVLDYGISLSITVSISLLVIIIFAAIFGTVIPLTLEKYKIDPALATGPFITTINDILGLLIYLMIGQAIL